MAPLRKVELFPTFFCCLKWLHLCKWCQNSASRGAELRTIKRLLKRSRFGSPFFLSEGMCCQDYMLVRDFMEKGAVI